MIVPQKTRWYTRWWVILLAIVILAVGSLFGWKTYQEWYADRELAAEVTALNTSDPHWQYEQWELRLPAIEDKENLALVALQLKSKLSNLPTNFEKYFSDIDYYPANVLSLEQTNMLKSALTDCAQLPSEIEHLRKLSTGAFAIPDFRDARYRIMASQVGRQQELRGIANLLQYYALLRMEQKDASAAEAACEAMLKLGHACEHDPFLISHLVRIAIQGQAVPMFERLLSQSQPDARLLERMQASLLAEAGQEFCKTGIAGDRAGIDRFLREVEDGKYTREELSGLLSRKPSWRGNYNFDNMLQDFRTWMNASPLGYLPAERVKSLRFYNAVLARMTQTPAPTLDEMKELVEQHRKESRTVSLFGAALPKIYEADLKRRASLQMCAALMAAERYRLSTGKLPSQWNDLVPAFLPAIPVDPYSRQPVRWKQTPTGFTLYCVWINGVDDDGKIRPGVDGSAIMDTGVAYLAPQYRRQPARTIVLDEIVLKVPVDQAEEFFAAARNGNLEAMNKLIASGMDVNTKTEYGATALCFAAEKGHLEIVKLLLEHKIDLSAKDTFYNADALTWAAMKDQHEAVSMLLKAGAKGEATILSTGIQQNKAKMVAAALGSGRITQEALDGALKKIDPLKTEIVKLLIDAGAKGKPGEALAEKSKTETPAKTSTTGIEEAKVTSLTVMEPAEKVKERQPWPGFRGKGNAGIADGQLPPTTWDATTGKHLLWKTPIPGLGLSCPIVYDNRLYVTTAINTESPKPSLRIGQYGDVDSVKEDVPHTWKTYCLHAETGRILWERTAMTGVPRTKRHMKSSHANATPVTDGRFVVVNFGSEGLYCYSMEGFQIWKRELGKLGSSWFFNPEYEWGFGSSPVIYGDTVIVQCDIGKNSFIAAYLTSDGTQVWSTPREELPSWSSPTLVEPENGPAELVTVASKYARGYDPLTGRERWRLGKFSEIAVPTPFYSEGLIFLTTGYRPIQPIYAIRPGALGDISLETGKDSNQSVVWSKSRGGPYLPTPLVYRGYLYVCNNAGVFSCYEAKTGKVIYQKRLGGKNGYTASLVAADGRIYCTDEEGMVRVVKAGPEFQLLAINKLGEECLGHPAISNGRIYFRAREHVMAFGIRNSTQ